MSTLSAGLHAIANEPANEAIVRNFLRVAAAAAVVPVLVYFATAWLVSQVGAGVSPPIAGGIAAVFALNVITAGFAVYAVNEKTGPPAEATLVADAAADGVGGDGDADAGEVEDEEDGAEAVGNDSYSGDASESSEAKKDR